ncbi:MAG: hypothetical protein P8O70_19865 [SAR324 cluster bacterium]|nr:hypothetical protein [SAR324 cluster bacterium]
MNIIRRKLFQSLGLLIGVYALSSQQKVSADGLQNTPQSPLHPLIQALRQTHKPVCLSAAQRLEKQSGSGETFNLHLRSANLDISDAQLLANAFTSIQQQGDLPLNSFSVSYNPGIETGGVQALLSSLPHDVNEIGLVECQLGDDVGELLIHFMAHSSNLKMICVEGNLFSASMRGQIASAGKKLGGCVTIV